MEAYIHLTIRSKYEEPEKARHKCVDCKRFWVEAINDASNMEDEALVLVDELGETKMYYGYEVQHAAIIEADLVEFVDDEAEELPF